MFNLLMFNVDWPSGRVMVPLARMFSLPTTTLSNSSKKTEFLCLTRLSPCRVLSP